MPRIAISGHSPDRRAESGSARSGLPSSPAPIRPGRPPVQASSESRGGLRRSAPYAPPGVREGEPVARLGAVADAVVGHPAQVIVLRLLGAAEAWDVALDRAEDGERLFVLAALVRDASALERVTVGGAARARRQDHRGDPPDPKGVPASCVVSHRWARRLQDLLRGRGATGFDGRWPTDYGYFVGQIPTWFVA